MTAMATGDLAQTILTVFVVVAGWANITVKAAVPEPGRVIVSLLLAGTTASVFAIWIVRVADMGSVQWLYNLHLAFLGLYAVVMTVRLDILFRRDYRK